jgi:hypothetical protein
MRTEIGPFSLQRAGAHKTMQQRARTRGSALPAIRNEAAAQVVHGAEVALHAIHNNIHA